MPYRKKQNEQDRVDRIADKEFKSKLELVGRIREREARKRARKAVRKAEKKTPKYGNAFLDALADASEKEARKSRVEGEDVMIVEKDGFVAMKVFKPEGMGK